MQTTHDFFEHAIKAHLPPLKEVGGIIEFDIDGDGGGTWFVDLDAGQVTTTHTRKPNCIIRAHERDFRALVEGRMSPSDGLLTERLSLNGDITRLNRLMETLARPSAD